MMGMGYFGLFFMVIFWVALILLAVGLVRLLFTNGKNSTEPPGGRALTAREILDQRYARGEITREQYEQMRKDVE